MLNNPCINRVPKNPKHFLTEEAEKGNWQVGCPQGPSPAPTAIGQNMPRGQAVRRSPSPIRLRPDSEHSLFLNDDDAGDDDNDSEED